MSGLPRNVTSLPHATLHSYVRPLHAPHRQKHQRKTLRWPLLHLARRVRAHVQRRAVTTPPHHPHIAAALRSRGSRGGSSSLLLSQPQAGALPTRNQGGVFGKEV